MSTILVEPVIDLSVRGLCCRPYPGHPKGCPNFGRKPGCPPEAPTIDQLLDLNKPVFAVFNEFDLMGHVKRMRERHPGWSCRQLVCCLYWQAGARKQLRANLCTFLRAKSGSAWRIVMNPEGAGVNVTATMESVGIMLEWPPRTSAYQVAFVGHAREQAAGQETLF